jgi:hypothetical protein
MYLAVNRLDTRKKDKTMTDTFKDEMQRLANLINETIYCFSHDRYAAAYSTLAQEYFSQGLHVVYIFVPMS